MSKGNATGATRKGTIGTRREGALIVYTGRLRLEDGTKSPRFDLPEEFSHPANAPQGPKVTFAAAKKKAAAARAHLAKLQAAEDVTHEYYNATIERKRKEGALASPETVDEWFKRFLPTKECGASHRRITGDVWSKYVSPVIGPKRIASLTRDDIEDVRDGIDRELDAGKIRHRTAQNAWGCLTSALKAAYASRDRSLRVLPERIYADILPPKKGRTRSRPWIYPSEWVDLCQHEDLAAIPIVWRRIYAIALYTGLRPGELRALTWADVDLTAKTINVNKAIDAETGKLKTTKSEAGQRVIPILPELFALLEAMAPEDSAPGPRAVTPMCAVHAQPEIDQGPIGSDAHALPIASDRPTRKPNCEIVRNDNLVLPELDDAMMEDAAKTFRAHLTAAGVTRARLTADTESEEPVDFRSLRDSHATWLALARTPDKVIQRRMGHATASTTDGYIKAAEALDPVEIGAPFPPLGVAFFWSKSRSKSSRGKPIEPASEPVNGEHLADRPGVLKNESLQILPAQPTDRPESEDSGSLVQNPVQDVTIGPDEVAVLGTARLARGLAAAVASGDALEDFAAHADDEPQGNYGPDGSGGW